MPRRSVRQQMGPIGVFLLCLCQMRRRLSSRCASNLNVSGMRSGSGIRSLRIRDRPLPPRAPLGVRGRSCVRSLGFSMGLKTSSSMWGFMPVGRPACLDRVPCGRCRIQHLCRPRLRRRMGWWWSSRTWRFFDREGEEGGGFGIYGVLSWCMCMSSDRLSVVLDLPCSSYGVRYRECFLAVE